MPTATNIDEILATFRQEIADLKAKQAKLEAENRKNKEEIELLKKYVMNNRS